LATETVGQEQELRSEALTIQQKSAIKIVNQQTYNQAADALKQVKGFRNRWKAYWEPLRENAYSSYKAIMDKIREGDDPLAQAERSLKNSILDWDEAQRREQERLQAEAQRKAEADEEAKRAQLAFEMEESGADEAAIEEVVSAPVVAVAAPVAPTYQKASGVSTRANWVCVVTDVKALCKAIGAGKLKLSAEDTQATAEFFGSLLKHRAVSDKETMDIAGCKAENKPIIAGRF
jgi:gas vesicle protein